MRKHAIRKSHCLSNHSQSSLKFVELPRKFKPPFPTLDCRKREREGGGRWRRGRPLIQFMDFLRATTIRTFVARTRRAANVRFERLEVKEFVTKRASETNFRHGGSPQGNEAGLRVRRESEFSVAGSATKKQRKRILVKERRSSFRVSSGNACYRSQLRLVRHRSPFFLARKGNDQRKRITTA